MGTVFSFDLRVPATRAVRHALAEAVASLHHVDAVFSTYRPDSAISRLARGETALGACPPEVAEVLALCADAARATDGWFTSRPGGVLDPSGLVKGWAVDRAADLLVAAGAANACVNGGGDIRLCGEAAPGVPWRTGIADPLRPGRLRAVVTGRDLAVATSGTAERGAHILDPHTGRPATGPASVTVAGPRLAQADAYATAAFATGERTPAWLARLPGYTALTVTRSGEAWATPGFPLLGPPDDAASAAAPACGDRP
ncbi:FAD:protein FMN transferase [Streptomyces sp. NPDC051940]|uniref:FAD:protein FMN transferase n=1 Tax=Streptomyces sp. NPDC051940 TaxID=3155675 RepID=UPI0034298CCE